MLDLGREIHRGRNVAKALWDGRHMLFDLTGFWYYTFCSVPLLTVYCPLGGYLKVVSIVA